MECPVCDEDIPVEASLMDVSGIFAGEYVLVHADTTDMEVHLLTHETG